MWGGDGFDTLTGGDGDDFLSGNSGRDRILGGAGWDTIIGGESDDVLTGGADSDYFLFFGAAPGDWGVDRITDFEAGIDGIVINAQWASDLSNGTLLAGQFIAGSGLTAATTAAQRLIYNSSTGDLYFDADGTGAAQARLFAVLNNLTADRIYTDNPF